MATGSDGPGTDLTDITADYAFNDESMLTVASRYPRTTSNEIAVTNAQDTDYELGVTALDTPNSTEVSDISPSTLLSDVTQQVAITDDLSFS